MGVEALIGNSLLRLSLPLAALAASTACTAKAEGPPVAEIDATLDRIYGHYAREDDPVADWETSVFTAANRKLISDWQDHIGDELTGLNDYGWFCECQDWDAKAFRAERRSIRDLGKGRVEVRVRVSIGWDAVRNQRLVLVREDGQWMVEDLFTRSEPGGIRKSLHRELAEKFSN
jgi:hypothetical protein